MNLNEVIEWGGVVIIVLLIFAETGLLLGLVIPGGETLVFTAGLLVSAGVLHINHFVLLAVLIAAGFMGDVSGYAIGKRLGPSLRERQDTWYFKKKYLIAVENFFKRHKRSSIIIGKFLPVIRPFAPLTASLSNIRWGLFLPLTLVAVVLYMSVFLLGGFYLGQRFPEIKKYLHWILPITVIVLVVPVLLKLRREAGEGRESA